MVWRWQALLDVPLVGETAMDGRAPTSAAAYGLLPTRYMRTRHRTVRPLLRGTIVKRTYGTHKKLYIRLFLRTILGPV